jgi:hypothetical protein
MITKVKALDKFHFLFIIFFTNLILRLIFFFYLDENTLQFSDQRKYLSIAETLLQFSNFNDPHLIQRGPIYPIFIFLIRSIFDNLFFVILVQNLIGIFSLFLVYNTCKLINKDISILTTFFYSINLNIILYQNLFMTESIFVNFFILSIYFLLKFLKKQKRNDLIYLSFTLAITALIRPQIYYIYIVILFIIIFLLNNTTREKIRFFLIFIIIFKSCLSIWEYRNYKIHNNYFFVIAKEANLIGYYLPHFDQYQYQINLDEAKKTRSIKWKNYLNNQKEINLNSNDLILKEKLAIKYTLNELKNYDVFNFLIANIMGSVKTVFLPSYIDIGYFFKLKKISFSSTEGVNFFEQGVNFILLIYKNNLSYFIFLVLSLFLIFLTRLIQIYGFIIMFKNKPKISIMALTIILFYLILLGPVGAPKYRIPFEIFFSLYLSYGVLSLQKLFKKKINN